MPAPSLVHGGIQLQVNLIKSVNEIDCEAWAILHAQSAL